jgi:hypothetical protein
MFYGQIPFEVSLLSQLSSLDMGWNFDLSSEKGLQLKELSLTSLVVNLTRLENLDLTWVNISSTVPIIFANLSTLRSLHLKHCGMHGEFPIGIFMLPNLRVLNMNYNEDLIGSDVTLESVDDSQDEQQSRRPARRKYGDRRGTGLGPA